MGKLLSCWIVLLMLPLVLSSQELTSLSLPEAYELVSRRYPALQNASILPQLEANDLAILATQRRPGIHWKADARLQSESVSLDGEGQQLPFSIDQPLVNAQTYVEADYLLLDGGLNDAKRALTSAQYQLEQQNLEVTAFQLRERVNQLALGITNMRAQRALLTLSLEDIKARKEQLKVRLAEGIILQSEVTKLTVRERSLQAQMTALDANEEGARESLAFLLGQPVAAAVTFIWPTMGTINVLPKINRPEQQVFQRQRDLVLVQEQLIDAEQQPKLRLFAQAGVGYPNPLNLLDSEPSPYALLGAGFSWRLTDWKKNERQRQNLQLQVLQIQHAEESFNFNLSSQEATYLAAIKRLEEQLIADEEIAQLQAEILAQLAVQLEEGVITSTEYLLQSNEELKARQQLQLHQIERLQTQLHFWNARGAF